MRLLEPSAATIRHIDGGVAPGPPGVPIFGNTLDAWRDPLRMVTDTFREYGDVAQFKFGYLSCLMVNEANAIQHVLSKNHKNYRKSRNYAGLKLFLGHGLLTSEGDFWKRQRRLASPAFHHSAIKGFVDQMNLLTGDMLDSWDKLPLQTARSSRTSRIRTQTRRTIDVHDYMMRVTLRVVAQTLFSTDVQGDAGAVGQALGVALQFADEFVNTPVHLPTWVPTPGNRRFQKALSTLDQVVFNIIEKRREVLAKAGRANASGDAPSGDAASGDAAIIPADLLSMFMQAVDDDQTSMTDKQLRDEIMTIVLAGHETTANALSWSLYLLSKHPDVERRVAEEVQTVLGDRESVTLEDLSALSFTEWVIQEAMRLYPPVWGFEREPIEQDVVGGYVVEPGTLVAITPYNLHRNPKYWDNPEGFDPERFSPERSEGRHRFAYLPFGEGARICIGKGFAMMEAKIILARILQRYRLSLVPGFEVKVNARITLRPLEGIQMELDDRNPNSAARRAANRSDLHQVPVA